MTACHLIADADLTLLGDVAAHAHTHAGLQLVAVLGGKDLDVDNDAVGAMGHTQGGVADLAGLLAEDGAQQALLGGQLGLALRGDLADEDVAGLDLGTDADDAAVIEVLQRVIADVRDVAGDLLGSELRVAGLGLIFFNVDGGVDILADELLVQQDGVLVVVALPGHEADQGVLAQADLAVAGRGAVGQHVAGLDGLAHIDDGALVVAVALVGAHELDELIGVGGAVGAANNDLVGVDILNGAVMGGQDADTGVGGGLVLHAGGDQRLLGDHQRHGLTLHVGAHQCTVAVVVLKERDAGRSDGNHHTRRNVHVVDLRSIELLDVVAVAAGDAGTDEVVVLVQRLVGLSDDILVLLVGGHIDDLIGDSAGGLVDLAVRGLNEAVLVDLGVGGQIGDQTDVRAFRRLDGAQTAIVGVVNVADLEACAVTGQTAGAQSGQTALVGQLGQRVVLVHELGQRAGTDELFDGGDDRADVDQALRGDLAVFLILQGHALTDDALHAGEADAELVLQQLTDAADAAVAQMVDLIGGADAVVKAQQVVDGGKDVIDGDGAADQNIVVLAQQLLLLFHIGGGVEDLADLGKVGALIDTGLGLDVEAEEVLGVDAAVGDDNERTGLLALLLNEDGNAGNTGVIDLLGLGHVDLLALGGQQLAGQRGDDVLGSPITGNAAGQAEFVVHLIAAKTSQVVTARVKEQVVQVRAGVFHRRGLTGAQLTVDLEQALLGVVGDVLFERGVDLRLGIAEELLDLLIGGQAQGTQQRGNGQLAVLIDTDVVNVRGVRLILQPGAAVGVHGGGEQVLAGTVLAGAVENAGRTDQLGDDGTLGTVGDEGTGVGHEREVAHEDLLLLHLAGLLVEQTGRDVQGCRIRGIPLFAFFNRILGVLVQPVIDELQHEVAGVVLDRGNVVEDLMQALLQEPVVRVFLDLDQIGHTNHFVDVGKAHAGRSAVLYGLDLYHKTRPLLFHRLTKLAKATRKTAVKLRHIRRFSQTF